MDHTLQHFSNPGETVRKVMVGAVGAVLGERAVTILREKIADWLGRLP